MSKTIKQQIRVLVKEHERGLLPKSDYRRLRNALLERAALGETDAPDEPTHTRPRAASAVVEAVETPEAASQTAPRRTAITKPQMSAPNVSPHSPGSWKLIAGIIVVIAVLVASVFVYWKGSTYDSSSVTRDLSTSANSSVDPVEKLLDNFVNGRDWTPGSVRHFARDWSDLDSDMRTQAKSSNSYREFARALRDRLKLSEQSNSDATAAALRELAADLDVRIESQFVHATEPDQAEPSLTATQKPEIRSAASSETQDSVTPVRETANNEVLAPKTETQDIPKPAVATQNKTPAQPAPAPTKTVRVADSAIPPAPVITKPVEVTTVEPGTTEAAVKVADIPVSDKINQTPAATVLPDAVKPPAAASTRKDRGAGCGSHLVSTRRKSCRDQLADGTPGPKLILIRAGSFQMGSSMRSEEQPIHNVTLGKSLAMGATEVSFAEFGKYCQHTGKTCPDNPWGDTSLPVVNISWSQAREFTQWLSQQSGARYRLPSEAEWEFAARAGTTTDYPYGDEISYLQAHFSGNKRQDGPVPVDGALVIGNEFGLKHVVGNVSEWVEDAWTEDYASAAQNGQAVNGSDGARRVVRGGSYKDNASELRSAARSSLSPDSQVPYTGFRVVREFD